MQYLMIPRDMTLKDLADIVGERNLDAVLNANGLDRTYAIGKQFYDRVESWSKLPTSISYQTKLDVLNGFVGDFDLYEKAALGDELTWTTLTINGSFPDAIKIPDGITLPSAVGVLGNGQPVADSISQQCKESLINEPHTIDPTIFSEYNASYYGGTYINNGQTSGSSGPFQYFKLPTTEIFLYSSLNNEVLFFPVYPKGFSDGAMATYEEMPEMLYQYEPWLVYKSSGPREITFEFEFHRDIWGDHQDGRANNLIRGCQANCYPNYNGSLVNYSLVSMYINNQNLITGVMTDCKVDWDFPIGLDGFYLKCNLSITIKEVSPQPLNYYTVRTKGLIQ